MCSVTRMNSSQGKSCPYQLFWPDPELLTLVERVASVTGTVQPVSCSTWLLGPVTGWFNIHQELQLQGDVKPAAVWEVPVVVALYGHSFPL